MATDSDGSHSLCLGNEYPQKDEKRSKKNKTRHEIGKRILGSLKEVFVRILTSGEVRAYLVLSLSTREKFVGNLLKEAETAHAETEEEEHFNTPSNDPLPNGEDSMQLNELMALCTQLQQQVLDLEKAKSDQAIEIASLQERVIMLGKRR
ncbi:hypothetical protein Tco_0831190 [Tanacetum coccineum]